MASQLSTSRPVHDGHTSDTATGRASAVRSGNDFVTHRMADLSLGTEPSSLDRTPSQDSATAQPRADTPIMHDDSDDSAHSLPALLSTLSAHDGESILSLCVQDEPDNDSAHAQLHQHNATDYLNGDRAIHGPRVYGGSQGGNIHVWDLSTLNLRARLNGHTGAVLALQLVREREWLISGSGDGTVRVWHTPTLSPLYLIQPPHDNIGDLLSLVWVPSDLIDGDITGRQHKGKGRLYAGCQDTSIQWIDLPPSFHLDALSTHTPGTPLPLHLSSSPGASSPPIQRTPNKFFDSLTMLDRVKSRSGNSRSNSTTSLVGLGHEAAITPTGVDSHDNNTSRHAEDIIELQFQRSCIAVCAHFGYVYSLLIGKRNDRHVLVSGSGDEDIKLWRMSAHTLDPVATLESSSDAVLALATKDSTVFAGHQGGVIKIWDLDTLTCIRTLRPHHHDILALSVLGSSLYSSAADGSLHRWNKAFQLVSSWRAHQGIALCSTTARSRLLTGGNDAGVKIWDVREDDKLSPDKLLTGFQGEMFHTLSKFIAYRTIADEVNREECRQGAQYLKRTLRQLGADTSLLPGARDRNPIVLATFHANAPSGHPTSKLAPPPPRPRRRVLFYGHYDVVAASADHWHFPPFQLTGQDGALYGRGVSDNKGPILAVAAAASELRAKGQLGVDLVMVVEGEEETGSAGFQDAIRAYRDSIGDIDVILVSNSYWIGEDVPCLTFGLRGVVHATVTVKSDQPDLHSGMQGGVVSEPLVDMVRLLASLTDSDGRVRIPGFLDDVCKLGQQESALYDRIVERCKGDKSEKLRKHSHVADPRRSLISRWRQPALSIHDVRSPGPTQKSLIPNSASAAVSIRIVPDQSLLDIIEQLKAHLRKAFGSLRTFNTLQIDIDHVADWWLGDIDSPYFTALAACIESEWGVEPLLIREGGSIPSLPFLEREFQADAVQFPMGTSSDSAHLPDERIKIVNLEKGKSIVSKWFGALAAMPPSAG